MNQPAPDAKRTARDDAAPSVPADQRLDEAIDRAWDAFVACQHADGHWCFELEADCTIPAEYILMMHFMDEIDSALEARLAAYLRAGQSEDGGWPLYYGGHMDVSCSVKAYYALKLAGDDPEAPHMARARRAILDQGGAARANVFTRIVLAQFGQIPWRGVPFIPVEIMLLPRWFFFHISKVSYWSRTVMVPLFILISYRAQAINPRGVNVRELFTVAPEAERHYFPIKSFTNRVFLWLDRLGRQIEPLIPRRLRERATRLAEQWFVERLNGEDGLGAIFPAMVNAYEALALLGYPPDHPYRVRAGRALRKLVIDNDERTYCQPCVSPVWDTVLASHALLEARGDEPDEHVLRALDWLAERQIREPVGDWREYAPELPAGGWAFQYANPYYPDLDDTAAVAWAMHRADPGRYGEPIERATDWLRGLQSRNGGFAAFDRDNTYYYLNEIPFADHGALLDPPTADVSARVLTVMGRLQRGADDDARERVDRYLRDQQETYGAWFGRWGTNYIYGTWSVLAAFEQAGIPASDPVVQRAVAWLKESQHSDGGWGETNDSYYPGYERAIAGESLPHSTAWALLGLMAAGEADSEAVRRGVEYLVATQAADGFWYTPWYTAPGFPRVFYLKYHGYTRYFPLWALARYRNERGRSSAR